MRRRQPDLKPLFTGGSSPGAKLMLFVVLSIALMTIDHRFGYLDVARSTLSVAVYPLQYAVDFPSGLAAWLTTTFSEREQLIKRNHELYRERLRMSARLLKYSALKQENARLRQLLDSSARFESERMLVAELLAVNLDPFRQQIVINKGARQGIYVGQPLLDAKGIIGQIVNVDPVSATAILISDPSHALPVRVDRNGLRTLAVGTGSPDELDLLHIPTNADVRQGDEISTSGLGGRYPADYPVGKITRIERPPGKPFARVVARPFGLIDRGREVLLLWTNEPPVIADSAGGDIPSGADSD